MPENNPDPEQLKKILTAATRLMQVHGRSMEAIASVAMQTAGGMVQLRSHERGIELHDDVTDQIKKELLDIIRKTYTAFALELQAPLDPDDGAGLTARLDVLMAIPYGDQLDSLGKRYKGAFKKSKLAMLILVEITRAIHAQLDQVAKWLVALVAVALHARNAGAIMNDRDELVTSLTTNINEAIGHTVDEVEHTFMRADPQLDAIAVLENKHFCYLLKEGYEPQKAFEITETKYKDKVQKVLYPETQDGAKTDSAPE